MAHKAMAILIMLVPRAAAAIQPPFRNADKRKPLYFLAL